MIYRISQTLACSRSAAVRIRSFSLFRININSGPAGFITYSRATNKLEVVFCQLFYITCRLSTFLSCLREMQAVGYYGWRAGGNGLQALPLLCTVAVVEMKRFNVASWTELRLRSRLIERCDQIDLTWHLDPGHQPLQKDQSAFGQNIQVSLMSYWSRSGSSERLLCNRRPY